MTDMKTVRLGGGPYWAGVLWLTVVSFACGSSGRAIPAGDSSAGGAGSGGSAETGGAGGTGATGGSGGSTGGTSGGGGGGTGGLTGGTGGVTGGSGGTGGGAGSGGSAGQDGGAGCNCGSFAAYRICCGDKCVNQENDPFNCGKCGNRCPPDKALCEGGTCQQPPCSGNACATGRCCGNSCCQEGQLCCSVQGPVSGFLSCYTPTAQQPTCAPGCAPLCISDRNLKQSISPVDPQEVLAKLSRLPISTWSYRSDGDGVRHLGPMAQDFKQAFGLGDTDRGYYSVDAHGVAFAAIQALERVAREQQERILRLEREKGSLERRLRALEQRRNVGR